MKTIYKPVVRMRPATTTTILRVAAVAMGGSVAIASAAFANPTGGAVAAGTATISNAALTTTVNQATDKAIINWSSFNIAPNETTTFNQPAVSSATLNRIGDSNPSQILGNLNANGQLMLVNKNGMFFGQNANVNVGALAATTADIDDADFLGGNYVFHYAGKPNAQVVNNGNITTPNGGYVAMVAPTVKNGGTITANQGKVALGGGDVFTLDLAGDKLVNFALPSGYSHDGPKGNSAQVDNTGNIYADRGSIQLSALAAKQAIDSVVNMSGVAQARSASGQPGKITLEADNVNAGGSMDTSGVGNSDGGSIDGYAHKNMSFTGDAKAEGGLTSGNGGTIAFTGDKNITLGGTASTKAYHSQAGTVSFIGGNEFNVNAAEAYSIDHARNQGGTVNVEAKKTINVNSDATEGPAPVPQPVNALNLGDRDLDGKLTVNLNVKIPSKAKGTLTGDANKVNVADGASIQQGVDVSADSGSKITAAPGGTFNENVTVGKNNIHIDPSSPATINGYVNLAGDNDSLSGFTVTGGSLAGKKVGVNIAGDGAEVDHNTVAVVGTGSTGVAITGANAFVHHNTLGTTGVGTAAVRVTNAPNARIQDNVINSTSTGILADNSFALKVKGNQFQTNQAMTIKNSTNAEVTGNSLQDDNTYTGYGISLDNDDNAKVSGNDIHRHKTAVKVANSDNVVVKNNVIDDSINGINGDTDDNLVIQGNDITGHNPATGDGILLNDSHNAKVKNNTVNNFAHPFRTTGTTTVTVLTGNNF